MPIRELVYLKPAFGSPHLKRRTLSDSSKSTIDSLFGLVEAEKKAFAIVMWRLLIQRIAILCVQV